MSGLKSTFFRIFSGAGKLLPLPTWMRMAGQDVLIPLYHVVSDESLPHIRHLYPVKSTSEFRADLEYLLKHLQAIDLKQLLAHVSGEKPLKKPSFLLTFDDGLREFYEVVAPILLEKGVPAVCFLNSGFMNNKALFFRYKASLLIEKIAGEEQIAIMKQTLGRHGLDSNEGTAALLRLKYAEAAVLDELAGEIGFSFAEYLQEKAPYMTSGQIRTLIGQGFHFGGHSIDHPEYQYLELSEQLRQTRESMEVVQREFALDYRVFAFPFTDFGVSEGFFEELYAGEDAPDLTFGTAGLKTDSVSRNLQRIPFEVNGKSAASILPAEMVYYMAKAPVRKNKIQRP